MADLHQAGQLKNKIEERGGRLVAVSKKFSSEDVRSVYQTGIRDFGENYVSEAVAKILELKDLDINWHFVGRVQSGNLNKIINNFYMIHSIHKIEHIEKINERSHKKQRILLQLQHDKDQRGFGLSEKTILDFIGKASEYEKIDFCGLMFMPPATFKGLELEEAFAWAKTVFEVGKKKIADVDASWDSLSMGMSADFECALTHGATHVRVGTAIFGQRSS